MSTTFWASYVLLWALVVFESLLVVALLRELGRIYLVQPQSIARDGVAIGSELPDIQVETRHGRTSLLGLLATPYNILVCALPECPFCIPVVEAAQRWTCHRSHISTVVLVSGSKRERYDTLSAVDVGLVDPDSVLKQLGVRASPFVFVAGIDGTVLAKGLANNDRDIRHLLSEAGALGQAREEVKASEAQLATAHLPSR